MINQLFAVNVLHRHRVSGANMAQGWSQAFSDLELQARLVLSSLSLATSQLQNNHTVRDKKGSEVSSVVLWKAYSLEISRVKRSAKGASRIRVSALESIFTLRG
jgi:hypothetical protein